MRPPFPVPHTIPSRIKGGCRWGLPCLPADVEDPAGSRRHGPLTISRASADLTLLIRRVADLAGVRKRRYSSRRAPQDTP